MVNANKTFNAQMDAFLIFVIKKRAIVGGVIKDIVKIFLLFKKIIKF